MHYVYLHGFASGPNSTKGRYFRDRFAELGITLRQPDLNEPAFEWLTLSSQLACVERVLEGTEGPVTLFGSSLGGLVAALQAIRDERVVRLVLMAPAFRFIERWSAQLGEETLERWRATGKLPIYHYSYGRECLLDVGLLEDARQYDEEQLIRPVPTLILHGRGDEVVDPQLSTDFARSRPYVRVQFYDTDHSMGSVVDQLWQETVDFCRL